MASIRAAALGLRRGASPLFLRSARPQPHLQLSLRPPTRPQHRSFQSYQPRQRQHYNRFNQARNLSAYVWANYRVPTLVAVGGLCGFWYTNHDEVPVTHRWRFNIVSSSYEKSIGDAEYKSIRSQFRNRILPDNHPYTRIVRKVVDRLLPASGIAQEGDWTVTVIDDPDQPNAFVLPGGHVFVFTGILKLAENEGAVAAVLSHEIAHNVAHHMGERLSTALPLTIAAIAFAYLVDTSLQFSRNILSLILELPNSRTHETEADHIGLLMMAKSCFDPEEAVRFWGKMQDYERKHGGAPPQFLSTHPSSRTRQQTLSGILPEAQRALEESGCWRTSHHFDSFKANVPVPARSTRGVHGKDIFDDFFE